MANWRNWREWSPLKFGRRDGPKAETNAPQATGGSAEVLPVKRETPALFGEMFRDPFFAGSFFRDPFFTDPSKQMGALDRWFGDFRPEMFSPDVDVTDEGRVLKVSAELPGMGKDDVKLSVEEGHLVIRGEKKNEEEKKEEGCYRLERSWGSFQRTLPLPSGLDLDHPKALFDNGVLTVRFDKVEDTPEEQKNIAIE
jgi:HSP20 family protein